MLQRGDDLRALAEQAVAEGADVIGMADGDGSQALVADVARRHDVAFVCVPEHPQPLSTAPTSRPHWAPTATPSSAASTWPCSATRVFVNNASLGVYASGSTRASWASSR